MKKRVCYIVAGIFSLFIVGLAIILLSNVWHNSKYGVSLKGRDITNTGMSLYMEVETKDGITITANDNYHIQTLTPLGWKQRYERPIVLKAIDWNDKREYFAIWDLDWKRSLDKLPVGIYRVEKAIQIEENGIKSDVYCYLPFLNVNWWVACPILLAILVVFIFIVILTTKKLDRKRRVLIAILWGIVLLVYSTFLFLYFYKKKISTVDVGRYVRLEEEIQETELYRESKVLWSGTKVSEQKVSLSGMDLKEQEKALRHIFKTHGVVEVRRLWYRYDALIKMDDTIQFAVDTKERRIYVDFSDQYSAFFAYIELTREENQWFKEMIYNK